MSVEEIIKSKKGTLIDVREESELINEGAVEGALHIPLGEIEYQIDEINQLEKPLVIFCRSGNRSGRAIDFLESEGVTDLHNGMGFKDVLAILKD